MRKIGLALIALIMVISNGLAEEMKAMSGNKMPTRFQAVSMDKAEILQEGEAKMYCPRCGMTLPMFYKTNHAGQLDGKTEQYCSIHCLAKTMRDGKVSDIKVVDNTTLKFIDAATASYVVGSSKAGTMSMTSKYAFAKKADADAFAKEFGGNVMNFDDTLASVENSLHKDCKMMRNKRAKLAQKGEMMYKKMCKPVDVEFNSVAEAKSYLKVQKPCGDIQGQQLQAIGIYLNSRNK